ncbi:unnamed protein product [Aphanomyces euteiches]
MRLVTPLALAASTVVGFYQPHQGSPVTLADPQQVNIVSTVHRALEDEGIQEWGRRHASPSRLLKLNRKLVEGKYEKKYRERCEFERRVTFGVIPGIGHVGGAVAGGIGGAMVGGSAGKAVGGKWGAKKGKAKDERIAAREAAANRQQRPASNGRQNSARFTPQLSGRRGPRGPH